MKAQVTRFPDNPIIRPDMPNMPDTDQPMGSNINGPSLIRVPDWIDQPLGRYYLYFAHHKGSYIRLAFSDEVTGPWTIHAPGTLQLEGSHFLEGEPALSDEFRERQDKMRADGIPDERVAHALEDWVTPHIASPDVIVDEDRRQIRMYFHGLNGLGSQVSRVATSSDGIDFSALPEILGPSYFRHFVIDERQFCLAMPGFLLHSEDGLTGFDSGPLLFDRNMRHSAVLMRGGIPHVFWTLVGEAPERIYLSTLDVTDDDWKKWTASEPEEVLRPEHDWEGAEYPLEPSRRGAIRQPVNQLRDPCIFEEDGKIYLLYVVAGESGIAISEITFA